MEMKTLIDNDAKEIELAEHDFYTFIKHHKALSYYTMLRSKPRNHPTKVIVVQGPTGTGKSKYCLDTYPNAYWKQRSQWWDGYQQQDTVILDEFYGWIPFDTLLRICDRYPLLVETKGGQVQFTASTVVITTNHDPTTWYKNVYFPALVRRVNLWIVKPTMEETLETPNWEDAHRLICDQSNVLLT